MIFIILASILASVASGISIVSHGTNSIDTSTITNLQSGIGTSANQPTCNSENRGTIYVTTGNLGVADTTSICVKTALDVYAWKLVTLT